MPYKLIPHDLDLAHKETYVGFKKGEELLPFYVRGADSSDNKLFLWGQILEGG